eukprot:SAG22_NODE_1934_length_3291_cov_1.493734_1_plen_74_part_00
MRRAEYGCTKLKAAAGAGAMPVMGSLGGLGARRASSSASYRTRPSLPFPPSLALLPLPPSASCSRSLAYSGWQ